MDMLQMLAGPVQSMMQGLFLHYKLGRALVQMFLLAEALSLLLTSVAAYSFGVEPLFAFSCFILLSGANTFSFLMAFSYFLFNIVRPRPRGY